MPSRLAVAAAAAALTVLVAGCAETSATDGSAPTSSPTASAQPPARISKVLTIVFENHGTSSALEGMPHLAAAARTYGRTTAYRALTHPSLPNYLAMAGGSTFGVQDDAEPPAHGISTPSVFDLALQREHTAATYAEGMSGTCERSSHDDYAVRHNPWAYFTSDTSRSGCENYDMPSGDPTSGALHDAISQGTLPDVGMLVPDLCHDAHDCSLEEADAWLATWLDALQAGPDFTSGRLAIVLTFDEDEGDGDVGSDILTVVVAPGLHAVSVATPLDHRSWTRWMTDLVGAPALSGTRDVPSLGEAFGL